ncbi:8742_t:CDS:1, partial [Funneliformis geosporum]
MGFWNGVWEVTKTVTKAATVGAAAAVITTATGPFAVPIGAVLWSAGKAVEEVSQEYENKNWERVGKFSQDLGADSFSGGSWEVFTNSAMVGKNVAKVAGFVKEGNDLFEEMTCIPP